MANGGPNHPVANVSSKNESKTERRDAAALGTRTHESSQSGPGTETTFEDTVDETPVEGLHNVTGSAAGGLTHLQNGHTHSLQEPATAGNPPHPALQAVPESGPPPQAAGVGYDGVGGYPSSEVDPGTRASGSAAAYPPAAGPGSAGEQPFTRVVSLAQIPESTLKDLTRRWALLNDRAAIPWFQTALQAETKLPLVIPPYPTCSGWSCTVHSVECVEQHLHWPFFWMVLQALAQKSQSIAAPCSNSDVLLHHETCKNFQGIGTVCCRALQSLVVCCSQSECSYRACQSSQATSTQQTATARPPIKVHTNGTNSVALKKLQVSDVGSWHGRLMACAACCWDDVML